MSFDKKLLAIFLLALTLRLYALGSIPSGFHNDEVDVGYVGKFLILHGRDPAGNILPLAFNKYGDFRPTGLFYLAGISQLIFGSSEFAVRLPTALFGALTVFPLFFLARELLEGFNLKDPRSVRHLEKTFDQTLPTNQSFSSGLTYASARHRLKRKSNLLFGLASSYFLRWLPSLRTLQTKRFKKENGLSNVNGQLSTVNSAAYFAAFFLAILPWHIVLSRAGHEAIVGYFLIIWGLFFLLKFLKKAADTAGNNRKFLVSSFLFLIGSYLFYHGTRTIVPLILLPMLLIWRRGDFAKFIAIFLMLTIIIIALPTGRGRLAQVIFYKNPGMVKKLIELPFADQGKVTLARIFHNKPVVYTRELVGQYLQYFSPDFLFLRGGYPERYLVPETGLLPILAIVFLVWGLAWIVKSGGVAKVLVLWLLVSPIGAVLTYDDIPSATRASFMIFPLVLIAGLGAGNLLKIKNALIFGLTLLLALELAYFGHQYLVHQRVYKGFLRDESTREMVNYIFSERNNYELIVAPHGPNIPFYYLFYAADFSGKIRHDLADPSADFRRGNVIFLRDNCPSHRFDHYLGRKVLFIDKEDCEAKRGNVEVYKVTDNSLDVAFKAYVRGVDSKN